MDVAMRVVIKNCNNITKQVEVWEDEEQVERAYILHDNIDQFLIEWKEHYPEAVIERQDIV